MSQIETTYNRLRNEIIDGKVRPGQKLVINDIVTRYGVSLGSVREALSRLVSEELVSAENQKGFRAAPVSIDELQDLTRTRIEIESLCLRSALANGDLDWETRIVAAYHRLNRTSEIDETEAGVVSSDWAEAHESFHSALVSGCDSRWLLRLQSLLYVQSERYRRLSIPLRISDSAMEATHRQNRDRDHAALMEAALARDEPRILTLIRQHFQHTADVISRFWGHNPPSEIEASTRKASSAH